MTDIAIVSTARTAMAKSLRGSFNTTHPIILAGHVLEHAIQRAGLDAAEVEDVILGTGMPEGATGFNIARNAAIKAGLPTTTSGVSINRYCSSGLQAIAFAADYATDTVFEKYWVPTLAHLEGELKKPHLGAGVNREQRRSALRGKK